MLLPGDPGQTDRPPLQARGRGPGRPLSWVIPPCPFTRGPHTDEKPRPETSTKPGPVGVAPGPGSVAVGRESRAAYWVHEAQDEPAMGAASVHAAPSSGAATHLGRARLGAVEGSGGFCPGVVGWGLNGEGCPREQDGRVRASQRNPHAGETSPGATATLAGCPRPPPPAPSRQRHARQQICPQQLVGWLSPTSQHPRTDSNKPAPLPFIDHVL